MTALTRFALPALASLALAIAPASAQEDVEETYTFLATTAVKGQQCGLLERWESATILAETDRYLNRLAPDERDRIGAAAEQRIAATLCDDAAMNDWIDAARPGIETEWLPPNLALFKAMVELEPPPPMFLDLTSEADLGAAVAAIEAQFAAYEAAGVTPEGDAGWDAFLTSMHDVALAMAAAATFGGNDIFGEAEAQAIITEATLITTLWLAAAGD